MDFYGILAHFAKKSKNIFIFVRNITNISINVFSDIGLVKTMILFDSFLEIMILTISLNGDMPSNTLKISNEIFIGQCNFSIINKYLFLF